MKLYLKLCSVQSCTLCTQLHTVCTAQLVKCSHSSHWSHCLYSLCTTAWDFVPRALWWRCRNKDNISQSRHALGRTSTAASLLSGTSLSCAPTCQLSAVSCQLSTVSYQLSFIVTSVSLLPPYTFTLTLWKSHFSVLLLVCLTQNFCHLLSTYIYHDIKNH